MSGKNSCLSAATESDLSAKQKGMKKDEITKMLQQNEENLTTIQKMTIVNIFKKMLQRLLKI